MKYTIEVEVPEGLDVNHIYSTVSDALYLSEHVTQEEYDVVLELLDRLATEMERVEGNDQWGEGD